MENIGKAINTLIKIAPEGYATHSIYPDTGLVLCVVNDLYKKHPERFGPPEVREQLEIDVADFMKEREKKDKNSDFMKDILVFLNEKFDEYGINPLSQTRITFVACRGEIIEEAAGFFDHFEAFNDIHPDRGSALFTENWQDFSKEGKYDYVLTGNVLNTPNNFRAHNVFAACACILKKDGIGIHALGFSNDNFERVFHEGLHVMCGQEGLNLLTYEPRHGYLTCVEFAFFRQKKEVSLNCEQLQWLRDCTRFYGHKIEHINPLTRFFVQRPELLPEIFFDVLSFNDGVFKRFHYEGGKRTVTELSWEDAQSLVHQFDPNYVLQAETGQAKPEAEMI